MRGKGGREVNGGNVGVANMTAYERVREILESRGTVKEPSTGRLVAQCPAHDDRNPSLSVTGIEGSVLLYCHAGCATAAVVEALGITMADLFDNRRDTTYEYPGGRRVHRKADKSFPQSGNKDDRSLYRADRLGEARHVLVCEGEKDVLAAESVGAVAVCPAMGAGKARLFDWSPLRGRYVTVVADDDVPGHKHAAEVAELVAAAGAVDVRIVTAAVGKDLADHIAAGKSLDELVAQTSPDGAAVLDDVEAWFGRFICVTDPRDLALLAVWAVHTHVAEEVRTTPRLQLDSTVPESGKTTCLEHLNKLCRRPILIASPPSPALIPRLLEQEVRTVLLDEVDRVLRPDGPATPDLLSIINSGYKAGATRPALVPVKGGGWEVNEMPTFSPVVLSGNAPVLPDDTRSRIIRILLMPDYGNVTEDTDWEVIEDAAAVLHARIAAFADHVRDRVPGLAVDLPDGCVRRAKEKWRPLKRVAAVAGGRWPELVDDLIRRGLEEDNAEREAGLRTLPPGMVLLNDLRQVWPDHDELVPTADLVSRLIVYNGEYWGPASAYGKALTATRFGKLLSQAAKVTSTRPGGRGPRGYLRKQLDPVWTHLRIEPSGAPPGAPGAPGYPGEAGADPHRDNRDSQLHQLHRDPPPTDSSTAVQATPADDAANTAYRDSLCRDCHTRPPSAGRPRCTDCHRAYQSVMAGYDR